FPEVDRAEVEAVDHGRWVAAPFNDAVAPGDVVLHGRRPSDVVDRARPTQTARLGCGVIGVERAARIAARLVGVLASALEAERFGQELMAGAAAALKGTHAGEALEGELVRNLGMVRHERRILGRRGDELETKALRVIEAEAVTLDRALEPRRGEAQRPELERLIGAHAKTDAVDHPRARAALSQAWILEEGEVGAGASFLVGVEEVVDGGVVLVNRLLDQAHAHDAGVEEQVLRGVGRDRAYVVDAVQWFHVSLVSYPAGPGIIQARV